MDHVSPGSVEWGRVNKSATMVFKRIENLNYAVDLAIKHFKFSLVGVQGKDIVDGNRKLTLALIWQVAASAVHPRTVLGSRVPVWCRRGPVRGQPGPRRTFGRRRALRKLCD